MIAAVALLFVADRVELRTTQAAPLKSFPIEVKGPAKRLFVNGKATSIVVPAGYDLDVRCRDANGRIGGALSYSTLADPMYFVVEGQGFVTESGDRVRLLPIWPHQLDGEGRALGLTGSLNYGNEDNPGHAWLWDKGRLVDLGLASGAKFGRAGTIEGYYSTDPTGKPVNLALAWGNTLDRGEERYRPFVWWGGVRTEDALLKKPPF